MNLKEIFGTPIIAKPLQTFGLAIKGYKKEDIDPRYKKVVVCLDPGHSKNIPGKRSPYSLGKVNNPKLPFEEWLFAREITEKVQEKLNKLGIEVFVTTDSNRDGDNDVYLTTRANRANEYVKKSGKIGLFLSIHANAHGYGNEWTNAEGWSAYTTKGQNNSDKLADCLYNAAEEIIPKYGRKIRSDKSDGDRDWEENFTVIYKANMPAVLTENMFYTNIKDTEFLISKAGKDAIVDIHVNGIIKYIEKFIK